MKWWKSLSICVTVICHSYIALFMKCMSTTRGCFDGIMRWLSDIVQFLRYGYLQPTEDVDGTPIHHPRDALNSLAHQLDLNKVVKNSEQSAGVNPSLVVNEIDGIILWLQKRKDWMKQQENLARDLTTSSAVSKLNSDWSSSMPMSGGLGGDAFGLVEDDLDTFEMEGEESDDDDQWVGVLLLALQLHRLVHSVKTANLQNLEN